MDKNESRIEFINMKTQREMRFDISFYPKKGSDIQTNNYTLLNILANKIQFSTSSDSVLNKVYSTRITDPDKLKKHIDNISQSMTRWPKKK